MINRQEGFYLTHPRIVSKKDTYLLLSYCHIFNREGEWVSEQLFTFYVPTNLFFPGKESRLYEALLPLVPRHAKGAIFYSDCQEQAVLNLYRYTIDDKNSVLIGQSQAHHLFSPVFLGKSFYYGGTLSDGVDGVAKMEIEEQEGIKVSLGFAFI